MHYIVKCLFCPNNEHYKLTIQSLNVLLRYLDTIKASNSCVHLIGYCIDEQYIVSIRRVVSAHAHNVIFDFWDKNMGKCYLINECVKSMCNSEISGMFYMDHDVFLPDDATDNMLDVFGKLSGETLNGNMLGFFSLNQKQDKRHQYAVLENKYSVCGVKVVFPHNPQNGSIACGCFYMSKHCIDNVKQLPLCQVYGLDDYYLINAVVDTGILPVVTPDVYIVHPYIKDKEYAKWKKEEMLKAIKDVENNKSATVDNYWTSVDDAYFSKKIEI